MIEFRVRHSRESLARLYRGVYGRRFRAVHAVLWAVLLLFLAAMVLSASAPWFLVAGFVTALLGVVFLVALRANAVTMALTYLDQIGPELAYRVDDAGIAEESPLGRHQSYWRAFCGTREAEGHLLVERAPREAMVFVALPLDQLPPGAREAIEAGVRAARVG
jgi:hypothetical protein